MYDRFEKKIFYILEHVTWFVITMMFYRVIVFRKLEMVSHHTSIMTCIGILIFFCVTGTLYDLRFRVKKMGIVYNLCLGYGIYTCMAYYFAFSKWIVTVSALAAVLTILCLVALLLKQSGRMEEKSIFIKKKIHMAIYACRRNFAFAMFLFLFPISVRLTFADSIANASLEVIDAYGEEYNFANNVEMISKIRQEVWETLSFQEKVDVAQAIAYCEGNYLGIPQKMVVVVADLDDYILGAYEDDTYCIRIDTDHILHNSAADVLDTILHEAYHCYQERCVEVYEKLEPAERNLMLFYKTSHYAEEFNHYISSATDVEGYKNQALEADAREYARQGVIEYYKMIEEATLESMIQ